MHKYPSIHYIHFETLNSTNTWTKLNAHTLDPTLLTCVTAEEQTGGRGRGSRKWVSPKGENIYATLYFCIPLQNKYTHNLGQVLSLSCAKALEKMGVALQIKWPNDLLVNGKKIGGILTEVVQFPDRLGVVLGLGLNVNMEKMEQIDQPATSLSQLSGKPWALDLVLEPIIRQFIDDLHLLQEKGFGPFREIYNAMLAYQGEWVKFHEGKGVLEGVTAEGKLRLRLADGKVIEVISGEIQG